MEGYRKDKGGKRGLTLEYRISLRRHSPLQRSIFPPQSVDMVGQRGQEWKLTHSPDSLIPRLSSPFLRKEGIPERSWAVIEKTVIARQPDKLVSEGW